MKKMKNFSVLLFFNSRMPEIAQTIVSTFNIFGGGGGGGGGRHAPGPHRNVLLFFSLAIPGSEYSRDIPFWSRTLDMQGRLSIANLPRVAVLQKMASLV